MSDAPVATGASRDLIGAGTRKAGSHFALKLPANSDYIALPLLALAIAAALFALFLLAIGKSPVDFVDYVWRGGFGTAFSFQNTLQRSAPLILTALAVAIPARIGLIMIGGEGALVLGGFVAAAVAIPMIRGLPPSIPAPALYRQRDHELFRGGGAARRPDPQQAVDQAARRRLYGRQNSGYR